MGGEYGLLVSIMKSEGNCLISMIKKRKKRCWEHTHRQFCRPPLTEADEVELPCFAPFRLSNFCRNLCHDIASIAKYDGRLDNVDEMDKIANRGCRTAKSVGEKDG